MFCGFGGVDSFRCLFMVSRRKLMDLVHEAEPRRQTDVTSSYASGFRDAFSALQVWSLCPIAENSLIINHFDLMHS